MRSSPPVNVANGFVFKYADSVTINMDEFYFLYTQVFPMKTPFKKNKTFIKLSLYPTPPAQAGYDQDSGS